MCCNNFVICGCFKGFGSFVAFSGPSNIQRYAASVIQNHSAKKRRKTSVTKKYLRIKFKIKPSIKHFFSSSFFSYCSYTKLHIRLDLLKTMLHKTTASRKFIVFGNTDCFFFPGEIFQIFSRENPSGSSF